MHGKVTFFGTLSFGDYNQWFTDVHHKGTKNTKDSQRKL